MLAFYRPDPSADHTGTLTSALLLDPGRKIVERPENRHQGGTHHFMRSIHFSDSFHTIGFGTWQLLMTSGCNDRMGTP
jgi:hypothetical protein